VKVKRIVSNVAASDVEKASAFYRSSWSQGPYGPWLDTNVRLRLKDDDSDQCDVRRGSGTAVPDISIEVDDIEEALMGVQKASIPIEYGPKTEPWGVRRFYVRDPFEN
jgi:catechol 2,3-dioxygenase-like lactoylglutathione lyase family enzyme